MGKLGYCIPCGAAHRAVEAVVVIDDDPMCSFCATNAADGILVKTRLPAPAPIAESFVGTTSALCLRGCGAAPHRGRCKVAAVARRSVSAKKKMFMWRCKHCACQNVVRGDDDVCAQCGKPRDYWLEGFGGGDTATVASMSTGAVQMQQWPEKGLGMDRLKAEVISLDAVPTVNVVRKPLGRIGELWVRFQQLAKGEALKVACRDTIHVGTTSREMRSKAKHAGVPIGERRVVNDYFCWKE
jgi:hypothetical protein